MSSAIRSERVLRSRKRTVEMSDVGGLSMAVPVPTTPEKAKRSVLDGGLLTPPGTGRKLEFGSCKKRAKTREFLLTPSSSPQKLVFGKESIYSKTKTLLQRSSRVIAQPDGSLTTRRKQYDEIMEFLNEHIGGHVSSSLYLTGPPGTGKTAQVESIIRNKFLPVVLPSLTASSIKKPAEALADGLKNTSYYETVDCSVESVSIASINCIAINDPTTIFTKIYDSLAVKTGSGRPVKTMTDLQEFMESYSKTTTFVVILDEMDKLVNSSYNDTQSTRVIFELFLLAKLPTIRLALIGIANSLDMKDRFLSRLNLRQDLLPKTIVFNPYTSEEMFEIIMNRLQGSDDQADCIFKPMAIKFAAKKCSGNTGDLRKLFDVLRSSIEIVELQMVASKINPSKYLPCEDSDQNLVQVGLPHVAKVFAQFMNNSSTRSRISKLNMQQKMVLCAIVHREKLDIFQSHCSLDDTYDYYVNLMKKRDSLSPLKRNEFLEICNALETCGVATIFQGKSQGKTRHLTKLIKSSVDTKEFEDEISKIELLKNLILN
ncbi:hypothetical protein HG535_0B05900 [Zygotorulaspora mrakii]|uniref:Cell division control protein n=1 Tax=Zygotorulaspora mrakii TaxID=42260 RepID=A0A7H9AZB0_ZYGMR|nr:uncharacterized protein HG535_0B05900 [Zygotorulaspora mrakii]QLG71546.1 hypothetical protein HG535_0B05900 [Zygotorulaspora mrakii]